MTWYLKSPPVDVLHRCLLVLNAVLPEELLDDKGHALDPDHGVTLIVQPFQAAGLAAHGQEDSDLGVSVGELVHVLKKKMLLHF